ncbi:alpha/beta-hydrolase [Zopfia rhizophila CBS 207.26]|uniref:Carboxylic ester hydrolase n=1 Tax=Zopfia rhizophila CBS 207.26 TaxID=1314779 RepID=A0A6A6EKD6_9PEZI|nr:alpha/beta-hydrolase [Zopfia rhizophila CBS 207.26]
MAFSLILTLALCLQQIAAVDLVVDLGYAKYRGTDRGNGIYRWAGMRYARRVSRLDGMRFAAPQDPLPEKDIINADKFGSLCISTGADIKTELGGHESEDCLFVNVFASAKATNSSSLPVYVFIQGGGFNSNGNANMDGAQLINAASGQMVVVNFNYRVGPYGFLASKEITSDKTLSLNNGLKDQRQLLNWVKTHIDKFGGDPDHIVLGGASAGAGSVVLQLTAYGGRDDGLFHAAAAQSQAFPAMRNVTESQFAYEALLARTGCKDLKCMQDMDAVEFQKAVKSLKMPYPGGKNPPLYFWNPTLDYDFIKDYTYNEIKAGHFVKVPTIFGDDTNEGTMFTPNSITSQERAEQFVADQYSTINDLQETRIRSVFLGPTNAGNDRDWKRIAADVYGYIRYVCPGLNISAAYVDHGNQPTWQYRWNVGQALHVSELGPVWFNGSSAASVLIHNYFVSFIRAFDPNKYKYDYFLNKTIHPEGAKLTPPTWEQFGDGDGRRMLFSDNDEVKMEDVQQDEHTKCSVISSLGAQTKQ